MTTERGMLDQSGPIRQGEELDLARLETYLRAHLPDVEGPFSVEQFPSGHSNLTYLLKIGDHDYVLRRPPFGNQVKSAHDMGREFRVLSRLWRVYEPAPRPFVHCEDPDIIGDDFYVMERRDGVVLRRTNPPEELTSSPDTVRRLSEAFIDNLADLHTLDYEAAGLGELGKPSGYMERQVTGWNQRYEKAKTDEWPDVERLGQWLLNNQPAGDRAALIHNDYKYDNIMLASDDLTRIVAVFDWEMATLGDPLMDLGATLSYWVQADDSDDFKQLAFGPTILPGSLTRQELAGRYAERVGMELPDILFFYGFGLFKTAVILQQIYARYARGLTQDGRFAVLNQQVDLLGRMGVRAIDVGTI